MVNKFLNFLTTETGFMLRLILIVVISGGLIGLKNVQKGRQKEFIRIQTERNLVKQIPDMENQIRAFSVQLLQPYQVSSGDLLTVKNYLLKGTTIKDGLPVALIDEQIYNEGDRLGRYQIVKISEGNVTLEDIETKETKQLFLPFPKLPAN